MKKKAQTGKIMAIVIGIVMVAATAGLIYGTSGLNNTDFTGNAPTWVVSLLSVVISLAIVRLFIR